MKLHVLAHVIFIRESMLRYSGIFEALKGSESGRYSHLHVWIVNITINFIVLSKINFQRVCHEVWKG